MSVIRLDQSIDIDWNHDKEYYKELPINFKKGKLYLVDFNTWKDKIGSDFGGGITYSCKIDFGEERHPEYSLISIAFKKGQIDPIILYENDGDWAVKHCPPGNVEDENQSKVFNSFEEMHFALYPEDDPANSSKTSLAPKVQELLLLEPFPFENIAEVILAAEADPHPSSSQTGLKPSRTTLSNNFLEKELTPNSYDLDFIFTTLVDK